MNTKQILQALEEADEEILLAVGFEDALVGIVEGACRPPVACYDYDLCVAILAKRGMTEDEAIEFMEFNVTGADHGHMTPLFIHNWRRK